MKRFIKVFIPIFIAVFLILFPILVLADTGPKPSVHIKLEGIEDEKCYVTLLSQTESTGPYSAYKSILPPDYMLEQYGDELNQVWSAFKEYKDIDDFYFLEWIGVPDDANTVSWTYYPPQIFEVLIYFPESNGFAVSNIIEKKGFSSYYNAKVDLSNINNSVNITQDTNASTIENNFNYEITVETNSDYQWQGVMALLARLCITLVVELIIAVFFGIKHKKEIFTIIGANIFTQILLNVSLTISGYNFGYINFVLSYFGLEVMVVVIESLVYKVTFDNEKFNAAKLAVYAVVANAASFIIGLVISTFIPWMF